MVRRGARVLALSCTAVLASAVALHGCGQAQRNGFAPDGGGAEGSVVASDAAASHADGPSLVGDGATKDAAPNCSERCSPDLHSVTDCSSPPHVITTCPPGQGCGPNFQCVPACDSAADNKSAIGCDYWAIPADGYSAIPEFGQQGGADGSCFAAFVTNTWDLPIHVSLEWNGQRLDASPYAYVPQGTGGNITYTPIAGGVVQPGQVAIVFLSQYGGLTDDAGVALQNKVLCPSSVQAAFTAQDIGVHGTGVGQAVHIATDYPAVVYDIYPYGGAQSYISSATLLLPTDVWDTNYVAVTAWRGYPLTSTIAMPSDVAIVAMQDGTTVQLLPTVPVVPRGVVAGGPANATLTYSLSRGQVLQLTQVDDLSGSPIQTNHPVGVWGGHYCMQIPGPGQPACDAAHEQIPPIQALGSLYAGVQYRSRVVSDAGITMEESVPYRMLGMVDGTKITYDPPTVPGPSTLSAGEVAEFWSDTPFVVRSQDDQHPFYFASHMTGGTMASDGQTGDPET
ncbi:MAG TPA: IgGFc-binding protein, partial [Polyangiaceae bacterium]